MLQRWICSIFLQASVRLAAMQPCSIHHRCRASAGNDLLGVEDLKGLQAALHHHTIMYLVCIYIYIYIYIYITLYNTISKCLHDRPKLFGRLCKHLFVIIGNCNTISKCLHDRLCSYVVDRASIYWCGKWCSAGDVAFFASECEACSHAALRKPLWVQGLCRH